MSAARETPPARRVTAIGRWLTGGRSGGSRHRDVQGGTTRAAVLGASDGLLTNLSGSCPCSGCRQPDHNAGFRGKNCGAAHPDVRRQAYGTPDEHVGTKVRRAWCCLLTIIV
jgi:hypothetical protein